ncbi:hypothetical protein [Thalassobium sp. R2A62]|jgi:hypothetical protein|uniref:hypothetical protein n=1 Tax=Thalassobium sp. R2A62 TaxID=633131 RepID=UPI0001B1CBE6|nr:hypothetical protein [Thalassobium sp. R2A62]EET47418.1 hypothetical protein TR2A62_0472 [Thalassobium sp. R2A62]MDG1340936.1 hypothetical protein [Paracoccaceae bacterium]MDG1803039.1 hypothetical protein [Paracoccaceae bacterium]MDG2453682.1 hypothetical protein [Paracoccaceae bacterium]
MIFPIGGLVLGALFGGLFAKIKGGKMLDVLQYAATCAILLGLIGLFLVIFIDRQMF